MLHRTQYPGREPLFHAVGCICWCSGRTLLLQRAADKAYPRKWGFPGGKLEEREQTQSAVIRETYEETGIQLAADDLVDLGTFYVVNEHLSFTYSIYYCNLRALPRVTVTPSEHIQYGWFTPEAALHLDLVPDVDECFTQALPQIRRDGYQAWLFPDFEPSAVAPCTVIEDPIKTSFLGSAEWPAAPAPSPWYVSLGPPGAGKTTALGAIAKALPHMPAITSGSRAILNKGSRLNFYLRKAFEENDSRFFFPFQMEVLPLRYWLSAHPPAHALVDETIFSSLAYSRALYELQLLTPHEYETFYVNYRSYLQHLAPPTAVFFFHCPVETLRRRIRGRGRVLERFYSDSYLNALSFSFAHTAIELAKDAPVRWIDTARIDTRDLPTPDLQELYGLAPPV